MLIRVISFLMILFFLLSCVPCLCVREIIIVREKTVVDTIKVYNWNDEPRPIPPDWWKDNFDTLKLHDSTPRWLYNLDSLKVSDIKDSVMWIKD
jgi:hypothetical protein